MIIVFNFDARASEQGQPYLSLYSGVFMWLDFLSAVSLVFVIEGMMPFISPARWRATMMRICLQHDKTLRTIGFICMMIGVLSLTIIHQWLG